MKRRSKTVTPVDINLDYIRKEMSAYQLPSRLKSIWQLANTLIPYMLIWGGIYYVMEYSFWVSIPLILLAAGFLVRIFIIFHDCTHGSFFQSRKAINFWGRVTGVLTFTPFYTWKSSHVRHHGTSGNLDRRGQGDVWTMTVAEYKNAPLKMRIRYRLYRNPAVMFLLGPLYIFLVSNRFPGKNASKKEQMSVYGTNAAILIMASALSLLLGLKVYVMIQFLILYAGLIGGVWLFYVQHQFEDVYWAGNEDWNFVDASLQGASFYKLPLFLTWFTGNVGYHHIHHLNPGIPNYNLPKCQKDIPVFGRVEPIGLISSLKSIRYRLWDEQHSRLVGFRSIRSLDS